MTCPDCGHPVPPNEWAAYHRHEDCYLPRLLTPTQQTAIVLRDVIRRKTNHELGGTAGLPGDRHRAGHDPAEVVC